MARLKGKTTEFTFDFVGESYVGTYRIWGRPKLIEIVTIFGRETTALRQSSPELLASIIAREQARKSD